ncbi:PREDICTED: growth arrest-specific protein 7 isoform X2 [Hipposideros armiger]|uniref:Growth arrest-specific protein 7 isoform X2 n=1 Tax=Hipposideros armiger TaxID=186990 RepID=A0A8B7SDQ6_HIPAR|nr:PREDICTED: growth arrest-specific protein 7 isoform X2 [Hipposideros armiger]
METVIGRRIRPELSSSLGGSWDVRWCRSLEWSPLRQEKKARLSFSHLAGKATCLPRGGVTMSTRPPMRPPGSVPAVLLGFQPARAFTGALCLQQSSLNKNLNGYHASGTPAHPPETAHMSVRKSTGDPQNLGSSSPGKKHSKENTITINCVTFPHPDTMPEQQLLKPTEWSYCDYFWADKKDPQGNGTVAGFELLLQKQLKGKQMQKEMSEFIRERIKIEEDYAKNLAKLSQNSLAAQEEGSLGEAWAQVKKSLADEAEVHLKFSSKLHSEVEKPLMNFRENFKKDMKKCDHHIADLRKQLASRYVAVEKARKALTERQRDLEMKTQQLEIKLSNKTEEDIKKARRKSTQAGDDLMRCVDLYNQAQSKWFEEMVTTTLELERLEVERVEMIRQHLCQYTQLRHETDMFNQSTVEPVDQLLRKVDPAKDRELWVREHKTGNIRPVDMEI